MSPTALLLLALVLLVAACGAAWVASRRGWRARRETGASAPCSFVRFDPVTPRETNSTDLEAHGAEWRAEMARIGERLRAANVCGVVFVYGTFAGEDPLAVANIAARAPRVGRALSALVRRHTQKPVDALLGDVGTFGEPYVRLFEKALGGAIPCTRFVWSSQNHHLGRLEAAIDLARVVSVHATFGRSVARSAPRVLLVGHSHGGQLFALLSHLVAARGEGVAMLDVARARRAAVDGVDEALDRVRRASLDAVTLGTAARYPWADEPRVRALHLVNHCPDEAPSLRARLGLGGDAIRRLAAPGSDLPATTRTAREKNARLDSLLGRGADPRVLLRELRKGVRVDATGHTYFVDYGDPVDAVSIIKSGVGHGVYTRFDAMLFTARLIADHFYPEPALRAPRESRRPSFAAPWLRRRRSSAFDL